MTSLKDLDVTDNMQNNIKIIQEVINAMVLGGQIGFIGQGMHIHPALPELILRTFSNLREPSI